MVMWPSLQSVWALSLWEAPLERILKPSWLFAKSWHLRRLNHWKTTYDALQVAASQLPKKICAFLMSHILWSRCCYWNFTGWPNRWWISRAAQRKPPMSSKVGRNLAITWTPWPQMLPATQGQAIEQPLACPGGDILLSPLLHHKVPETVLKHSGWLGQLGMNECYPTKLPDHLFQINLGTSVPFLPGVHV